MTKFDAIVIGFIPGFRGKSVCSNRVLIMHNN